jgi:hypothetical protein
VKILTDNTKRRNVEARKAQPKSAIGAECSRAKRVAAAELFNTSNDLACAVSPLIESQRASA